MREAPTTSSFKRLLKAKYKEVNVLFYHNSKIEIAALFHRGQIMIQQFSSRDFFFQK